MVTRLVKTVMVASLALFALLATFNNLVDYGSNFEFVRHVLSMDTTFPNSTLMGRAIASSTLWHFAYWLIILMETTIGGLMAFGALRLAFALTLNARSFNAAKKPALLAAGLAFLLWFTGFIVVGGEWFAMWQSKTWNAQESAFRMYITILAVAIFLNQPDAELEG